MTEYLTNIGLSKVGMSATSGLHSKHPNPLSQSEAASTHIPLGQKSLQPADWVPSAETKFRHRAKSGDVYTAPISIGAWPWGDKGTFRWKEEDRPQIDALWDVYRRAGLNFIDTAQFYGSGRSEEIVGEITAGMQREEFVIQTKYYVVPSIKNILSPIDAPASKLKDSLKRMKLEFVDIYLVHGPIHPHGIDKVAQGMAKCVEEGLTRAVGVANYSKEEMIEMEAELAKYGIPLACNQVEFSCLRRIPETSGLLDECKKRGIVMQSYSSLAQARLGGKYDKNNPPPKSYAFSDYPMAEIEALTDVLKGIAAKRNVTSAAVALNYNLSKGVLPLVGTRTREQAESNVQTLGWRLTPEEVATIDEHSVEGYTTSLWQHG